MNKGFGGEVIDIGGGEVHILVDRDIENYPEIGEGVCVAPQIEIENVLTGLALGDHMGDVNDYLPRLCSLLGLPEPTWHDQYMRFVMEWETNE